MKRRLLVGIALCALLSAGWLALPHAVPLHADSIPKKLPAPLVVETMHPQVRAVPIRLEAVGQVESEHVVQIRPEISGQLTRVAFAEGDDVGAGQLLFEIDPEPFKAALAQAAAALARDQATLERSRWQEQRLQRLARSNYAAAQDLEDAKAAVKVAAAVVEVDRAALRQAQIRLRYTKIRAPIAGRTGSIAFREGNLVEANGATPLVTINRIAPIRVRFSVPQTRLHEIRRYRSAGSVRVNVPADASSGQAATTGKLVFIDNTVDPVTGTVALKAEFANVRHQLWPGQYVTVQLVLSVQRNALVVPDSAVQPGQGGTFVYVIEGGRARVRQVTVARQLDGWSVISSGLQPNDLLVARLPRNLRDGRAVKPVPVGAKSVPAKPASPAAPPRAPAA